MNNYFGAVSVSDVFLSLKLAGYLEIKTRVGFLAFSLPGPSELTKSVGSGGSVPGILVNDIESTI